MQYRSSVRIWLALLAGSSLLLPSPLDAQRRAQGNSVLVVALTAVRERLHNTEQVPRGFIWLDPRPIDAQVGQRAEQNGPRWTGTYEPPRDPARVAHLARELDAKVGTPGAAIICAVRDDPSSCRLHGAVAVLAASEPVYTGDEAQVIVRATYGSGLVKQPVVWVAWSLRLVREGCGWRVAEWRQIGVS